MKSAGVFYSIISSIFIALLLWGSMNEVSAQCQVPAGLMVSSTTDTTATLQWTSQNTPIEDHCWIIEVGGAGFNCGNGQALISTSICTFDPGISWDNNTGVVSYTVTGLQDGTDYQFSLVETCDGFIGNSGSCLNAISGVFTTSGPQAGGNCLSPVGLTVSSTTDTTATLQWTSQNTPIEDHCWIIEVGGTGFNCGNGQALISTSICTFDPGISWDNNTGVVSYTVTGLQAGTGYQFSLVETCDGPISNSGSCLNAISVVFTTSGPQAGGNCLSPVGLTVSSTTITTATLQWTSQSTPIEDHCWIIEVGGGGFNCGNGQALISTSICTFDPGISWDNNTGVVSYTVTGLQAGTDYQFSLVETCDGLISNSGSCSNAISGVFTTFDVPFDVSTITSPTSLGESCSGYVQDGSISINIVDGSSCSGLYDIVVTPEANSSPLGNTPQFTIPSVIFNATQAGSPYLVTGAGAGSYTIQVFELGLCNHQTDPVGTTAIVGNIPCIEESIPTMSQWAYFLYGLIIFTVGVVVVYNVKIMNKSFKDNRQ